MGRLHCKRCSKEVHPGRGDYYLVRIDAVADPSRPSLPRRISTRMSEPRLSA